MKQYKYFIYEKFNKEKSHDLCSQIFINFYLIYLSFEII